MNIISMKSAPTGVPRGIHQNLSAPSKLTESNGDSVSYLISNANGNGLAAAFATLGFFVCIRHVYFTYSNVDLRGVSDVSG